MSSAIAFLSVSLGPSQCFRVTLSRPTAKQLEMLSRGSMCRGHLHRQVPAGLEFLRACNHTLSPATSARLDTVLFRCHHVLAIVDHDTPHYLKYGQSRVTTTTPPAAFAEDAPGASAQFAKDRRQQLPGCTEGHGLRTRSRDPDIRWSGAHRPGRPQPLPTKYQPSWTHEQLIDLMSERLGWEAEISTSSTCTQRGVRQDGPGHNVQGLAVRWMVRRVPLASTPGHRSRPLAIPLDHRAARGQRWNSTGSTARMPRSRTC